MTAAYAAHLTPPTNDVEEQPMNPNIRTAEQVAADPRPLGWLFRPNQLGGGARV